MINGKIYRIGLVNGIWDGKGFEQVTKTQGGGSLKGCNSCDFPGITFAGTRVYPFYSRYLPLNDPRRLKRPPRGIENHSLMFNLRNEDLGTPAGVKYFGIVKYFFRLDSTKCSDLCSSMDTL